MIGATERRDQRPAIKLCRAALLIAAGTLLGSVSAAAQAVTSLPVKSADSADRMLRWRAEPLWRLVGDEASGLLLSTLLPTDVVAHPSGRTYILDRAARRVYVISDRGEVIDSLGRRGRGPGEFMRPVNITLDGENDIAVFDRAKRAFVRWRSGTHEILPEVATGAFVTGSYIEFVGDAFAYKTVEIEAPGATRYRVALKDDTGAREIARGPLMPARPADFPSCGAYQITVPQLFSPDLPWATHDGRIVVADGARYSLLVMDSSRATMRIERTIPPREVTREMVLRELTDWSVNDCIVPPMEALRGTTHADALPAIDAVRIAPNGEIWVSRGMIKGEPAVVDVFNAQGFYLGTLTSGFPLPASFWSDDSFVAITRDEFDVPVVTAYQLMR